MSLEALKKAAVEAPVLQYYMLDKEVAIQHYYRTDTLLPMHHRALTTTVCKYAQIEKEMLANVYACERFNVYIYGHDMVTIQSDHKPLEVIFRKSLCLAPKRLQHMMLRLENYNLNVVYTKVKPSMSWK